MNHRACQKLLTEDQNPEHLLSSCLTSTSFQPYYNHAFYVRKISIASLYSISHGRVPGSPSNEEVVQYHIHSYAAASEKTEN